MDAYEPYNQYEKYYQPVIILDSEFNIVYKNTAAKLLNMKPRAGVNIKKYTDSENMRKIKDAFENNDYKILQLGESSAIRRCVAQPDGKNFTALVFYDSLNLLQDGVEALGKIEEIVVKYNEYKKNLPESKENGALFYDNGGGRKMLKINEHFRRHVTALNPRLQNAGDNPDYKKYCEVDFFLSKFTSNVSRYINSFGYRIEFNGDSKMFFYKLNEEDFLIINFILAAAALKYSVFNKINIVFITDFLSEASGILRYEFKAGGDFFRDRGDMFSADYINEIKNIEYIDFNLAALAARNNGLKLDIRSAGPDGDGMVYFDVIFPAKPLGVKFEPIEDCNPETTDEKIYELAKTEFSGLFGQ